MLSPALYVNAYANLNSWVWVDDDWSWTQSPIKNYLQSGLGSQSSNAQAAHRAFMSKLVAKSKNPSIQFARTFKFEGEDYINQSITRSFIGKACPWELQETIQLGSLIGAINTNNVRQYCLDNLGVDCGGFVANYWGEGVPHMAEPTIKGATGISPRNFWANSEIWSDAVRRRRVAATAIQPGDAAVFFKDIKDNNPDLAKQRDKSNKLIQGTGSEAFHIGLVNRISASANSITMLEIAESSGSHASSGGNGVNVRTAGVTGVGKSGPYVYAEVGKNERIYFVAPPGDAGPEMPYTYGES